MSWIKITDQKPEDGQVCIVSVGKFRPHWWAQTVALYRDGVFHTSHSDGVDLWMPLAPIDS